jgi:hypothetical protein
MNENSIETMTTMELMEWEYEERSLQHVVNTTIDSEDDNNTDTTSSFSPVPAPSSTKPSHSTTRRTIAPTLRAEYSPVESPTIGGMFPTSNWTLPPSPTSWETETPGWVPTPSSSSGSGGTKPSYTAVTDNQKFIGMLVILILAIVVVCGGWKFCKVWKARRERHMLRLQSTRVDAVLGDMQMVPQTGEYDEDDPELL